MSMELMVKAMKAKVGNPLRKLVLIKLADNANDQGECWPSYQHVADQCEISRSTVKVHIRELEKAGLLRREFRRKGELNQSNVYHLVLDREASNDSGGGAAATPPGAAENPGGGAAAAPRTSHSFEPVKEPKPLGEFDPVDGKRLGLEVLWSFDRFWKLYPKKTKRKDAAKAWAKLNPSPEFLETILAALAKWVVCQDWTKEGGKYIPHPSTWLNGERWEDQLPTSAPTKQSHHTNLDEVDLLAGLEVQPDGSYRVARTAP